MTFSNAALFFLALAAIALSGVTVKIWDKGVTADEALAVIVGAAAVAQGFAAVVMMRGLRHAADQARAAVQAVGVARETSEHQLRAYVITNGVTLDEVVAADTVLLTARVKMLNVGQTPATKVRLCWTLRFVTPEAARHAATYAIPLVPAPDTSEGVFGSNQEHVGALRIGEPHLAANLAELVAGTRVIAAIGLITYVDIFGKARETRFAHYCKSGELKFTMGPEGAGHYT